MNTGHAINMKEQLISFKTAKLAKEKGFSIGSFNRAYIFSSRLHYKDLR